MMLKPALLLRLCLVIFFGATVQCPSICAAQTALDSQEQLRKIDQQLSDVEKTIAALQLSISLEQDHLLALEKAAAAAQPSGTVSNDQRTYLRDLDAERAKLEGIRDKMEQTAEQVSDKEMSFSSSYFQMFLGVIAIAAAAVAFAGLIVKGTVAEAVLRQTKGEVSQQVKESAQRVEKEMTARTLYESELAQAETFFQQSFAWYEHYEPEFQKFLRTKIDPDIVREIKMARTLAERGIGIIEDPSFVAVAKDDPRLWTTRATLTNLWVYNQTAEFVLDRPTGTSAHEKIGKLLKAADRCLEYATDRLAREQFWYEFQETAAFAMIYMGDNNGKERGRDLIRGVFAGKTPAPAGKTPGAEFAPPPKEWLLERWDEYFPIKTAGGAERDDPLGLGPIKRPA
jgi:hypothetical protein